MGLKKLAEKLADYNARVKSGHADKIKAGHVEKLLKKLRSKEAELQKELAASSSADKAERIERKLRVAREHIARAEWLLKEQPWDKSG